MQHNLCDPAPGRRRRPMPQLVHGLQQEPAERQEGEEQQELGETGCHLPNTILRKPLPRQSRMPERPAILQGLSTPPGPRLVLLPVLLD
jgi:hypothetical protein